MMKLIGMEEVDNMYKNWKALVLPSNIWFLLVSQLECSVYEEWRALLRTYLYLYKIS